jgi:hypothetical protein
MCVPIYLLGSKRTASANSHFLFHPVALDASPGKNGGLDVAALDQRTREALETIATDGFYARDLSAPRVSAKWLAKMRTRIVDGDVWLNGQSLVDEGSGVLDAFVGDEPH